jgi:hypothetical protein
MKSIILAAVAALAIPAAANAGWFSNKPAHYLVICDQEASGGYQLISSVKKDGYLTACTYAKPDDLSDAYTHSCDADGCNIYR